MTTKPFFQDEEVSSTNITDLEKQMWMMEDELSDAKLEASKLKTELASERSSYQIKFSEMQSRINEVIPAPLNPPHSPY